MSGYLEAADLVKERVRIPVELIGEQLLYFVPAELARWQTDAVDDKQPGVCRIRSFVVVGTLAEPPRSEEPGGFVDGEEA